MAVGLSPACWLWLDIDSMVMLIIRWRILGGFDGYLTKRDACLSALISTDRWLLAHHPSEKARSLGEGSMATMAAVMPCLPVGFAGVDAPKSIDGLVLC
jgi:hypothetical protein